MDHLHSLTRPLQRFLVQILDMELTDAQKKKEREI
ncbi:hypothetical protein H5410_059824 [Solanum commersonii]|uniref:Uncharacterized protein n=1 Tax=Solanum commersonii TaxID=4109 RepID=A0A9J5W3J6_SOLCO|nr:hypothetical protein H5410_059824 [Solanum commersonii]